MEFALAEGSDPKLRVGPVELCLAGPATDGRDLAERPVFGTLDQAMKYAVKQGLAVALDLSAPRLDLREAHGDGVKPFSDPFLFGERERLASTPAEYFPGCSLVSTRALELTSPVVY